MASRWNTVIVPLDRSELAEKAIPPARELASRLKAHVMLISVPEVIEPSLAAYPDFEVRLGGMMSPDQLESMRQVAREETREYLSKASRSFLDAGVEVQIDVAEGRPAEAIVEAVDAHPHAMIVMATHGRRGLSRWAYGSVADSVLQSVTRSLLLIPAVADHVASVPRSILVPLDGTTEAEAVLGPVTAISSCFDARVEIAHVMPDFSDMVRLRVEPVVEIESRYEAWLRDYMEGVRERLRGRVSDVVVLELAGPDVADALLAQAARDDVDLLAMTPGVHGETVRGATSGVVSRVLRNTRTPVLLRRSG
jgi:nucleotide-binding universal stress UspA family protein